MFMNFWYPAEESENITHAPMKVQMLGLPFVLWRDEAGEAHCISNTCTHRGGSLGDGVVVGDCVQCPYHGWLFDGAGQLHAHSVAGSHRKDSQARAHRRLPGRGALRAGVRVSRRSAGSGASHHHAHRGIRPGRLAHADHALSLEGQLRAAGGEPVGPVARRIRARRHGHGRQGQQLPGAEVRDRADRVGRGHDDPSSRPPARPTRKSARWSRGARRMRARATTAYP